MWVEIGHILKSFFLSAVPNGLELCYRIVNLSMLGYIGKGNLLAGGLGEAYFLALWCIVEGTLSAADELFRKFSAKRDQAACRNALFIACSCSVGICVLVSVVMVFSPAIVPLIFVGLSEAVSTKVVQYVYTCIPVLWVLCAFRMAEKYMHFQGIIRPVQAANVAGISVNIIANFIFLYIFGLGFAGCAVATLIGRTVALVLAVLHFQAYDEFGPVWADGAAYLRAHHPRLLWLATHFLVPATLLLTAAWSLLCTCVIGPLMARASAAVVSRPGSGSSASVAPDAQAMVTAAGDGADVEMAGLGGGNEDGDESEEESLLSQGARTKPSSLAEAQDEDTVDDGEEEEGDGEEEEEEEEVFVVGRGSRRRNRSVVTHRLKSFCLGVLSRPALRYLVLAVPSGLSMVIETWNCDLLPLVVACPLGSVATDGVIVVLLLVRLAHLCIALPLSTAVTQRIILLLESGSATTAKQCAVANIAAALAMSLLYGWVLYLVGAYLGSIFTYDISVGYRIWKIEAVIPPLVVASTLVEVCKGILRAQHRQRQCAAFQLSCTFLFGLGLAWYLAYFTSPQALLVGFWVGYTVGWVMLALFLLLYIAALTDWEREVRRTQLRMQLRERGQYHVFCLPRSGSLSVGGFPFARRDMYNNIDDLEGIELSFEEEDDEDDEEEESDDATVLTSGKQDSNHSR